MIGIVVAVIVVAAVGFAVGRVKNAHRLAEVKSILAKLEIWGEDDAEKVIAAIRKRL